MDEKQLDWIEKAAIENLRSRLASGDALYAQASTLLSILLVGIGGSLAYATKLADSPVASPFVGGMAVVVVWLIAIAGFLVWTCMFTQVAQLPYNEPRNLYRPELAITFAELRCFELENIQARIDLTKQRNIRVATWLDRCRGAAIATPVAFILGACVAAYQ